MVYIKVWYTLKYGIHYKNSKRGGNGSRNGSKEKLELLSYFIKFTPGQLHFIKMRKAQLSGLILKESLLRFALKCSCGSHPTPCPFTIFFDALFKKAILFRSKCYVNRRWFNTFLHHFLLDHLGTA